jgi:hypothetical protein
MKITSIVARYLLGLMFTVFGLNGFLNFIHQPPPTNPLALQFLGASIGSHFAAFFFAGQVLGGLLLLFGIFVPPCADTARCGALQHPCLSPDDGTGQHRSRAGRLRVVDSGVPALPRKLQGYLQRKACDAGVDRSQYERHDVSLLRSA